MLKKRKKEIVDLNSKEIKYQLKETKSRAEAYRKYKDDPKKLEEAYKILDLIYK